MTQKYNLIKGLPFCNKLFIISLLGMVISLYLSILLNKIPYKYQEPAFHVSKGNHLTSFNRPSSPLKVLLSKKPFLNHRQENVIEVAHICPVRFSSSLGHITNISSRKEIFVKNLLPSILAHNEAVEADRRYLLTLKEIKDTGKSLDANQLQWLRQLAFKYKIQRLTMAELLKRVDVIPPSLALGQAVVETGWGGSCAAQRFNSPFGMMKTRKEVFSYKSLQKSVSHYIHNLNTHDAYANMRLIRANLRNSGENLCAIKLVEGLTKYSELGKTYTSRVKNIIKSFGLQKYDNARRTVLAQQSS